MSLSKFRLKLSLNDLLALGYSNQKLGAPPAAASAGRLGPKFRHPPRTPLKAIPASPNLRQARTADKDGELRAR